LKCTSYVTPGGKIYFSGSFGLARQRSNLFARFPLLQRFQDFFGNGFFEKFFQGPLFRGQPIV